MVLDPVIHCQCRAPRTPAAAPGRVQLTMRRSNQYSLAGLFCLAIAAAAACLMDVVPAVKRVAGLVSRRGLDAEAARRVAANDKLLAKSGLPPNTYEVIPEAFEDGGYKTVMPFMAPIKDLGSLAELRQAVRGRGPRALAALEADYAHARPRPGSQERAEHQESAARAIDRFRLYV